MAAGKVELEPFGRLARADAAALEADAGDVLRYLSSRAVAGAAIAEHEREREAVVALGADRLDRRGADARPTRSSASISCRRREPSTAGSLLSGSASAPSRMTLSATITLPGCVSAQRPLEVVGRVHLVGVDEHEVERLGLLGGELRQRVERLADAQVDELGQARAGDVRGGELGVARVGLERDQATIRRQRARQPDRAVAAERADLEDRARADRAREQVQELALAGRDGDRRQAGGGVGRERRVEVAVARRSAARSTIRSTSLQVAVAHSLWLLARVEQQREQVLLGVGRERAAAARS